MITSKKQGPASTGVSRRQALGLAALATPLALSSSGCLFMALKNTNATEEELTKYWYTYAGQTPFADRSQGLVLGQVTLGSLGCTFNVQAPSGAAWENREQTLEFRTS